MTDQELCKLFQSKLLTVFARTIEFLNKNDIRWWVCGGTALGTIRHKGFIPWDDDIDIFVLREDYEKLFLLRDQLPDSDLDMKSIEDGSGYFYGFIKIFDKNTTIWERREHPDLVGVYIDVFPIEKTDLGKEALLNHMVKFRFEMKSYQKSITKVTISHLFNLLKEMHLKTFFRYMLIGLCNYNKQKSYERFCMSTRQVKYNPNGKNMMCIMGSYKEREFLDSKLFDVTLKMPFENLMVNVPSGYDTYLTKLYKDYMQLPPENKRVSHHSHYYINFSEGLSLEQVKGRIKQGKYIEL